MTASSERGNAQTLEASAWSGSSGSSSSDELGLTPDTAVAAASATVCSENLSSVSPTLGDWAPLLLSGVLICAAALIFVRVLAWRLRLAHNRHTPAAQPPERPPPLTKLSSPELLPPPDHPYYDAIDDARAAFRAEHGGETPVGKEREERLRSRLRSHDPLRWRISPSCAQGARTCACMHARRLARRLAWRPRIPA